MYKKYRMETPNPKCPRCKCYWKPLETDIKSSGLFYKTCNKCRQKNKTIKCECGSLVHFLTLREHQKSKRHLHYINNPCLVGYYNDVNF